MLYWVRRWRFSDLKRLPSSRQTRYSGVIDFFTDTAGLAGSSGAFVTMGGGQAILRNTKGVEIRLHTRDKGLQIHLAAGGAAISLN